MTKDFAEAFAIFATYDPKGYVAAEHDEIFVGCVPRSEMKLEHELRLEELHWRYDEADLECWRHYV